MSESTPAENETTRETVEVEYFGRSWSVPAQQRYSHMRKLREAWRQSGNVDLAIVDTFLSDDDLAALEGIDPTEAELSEFADAISAAVGLKSAGNS